MTKNKEYLYVDHYIDGPTYVLKIGTTNNLARRAREHYRSYGYPFEYDWYIPLSKYNTLRYEDLNRKRLQDMGIGFYARNDRFVCCEKPQTISIKIRKEYIVELK